VQNFVVQSLAQFASNATAPRRTQPFAVSRQKEPHAMDVWARPDREIIAVRLMLAGSLDLLNV
jgi:hypothetical protein